MIILDKNETRIAASYESIMDAVEEAFCLFTEKKCKMADRFTVPYNGNTMLYMPCFAGGYVGTKMLAEWPGNVKRGLPYLDGLMILNSEENGQVEAIMNGSVLTALRTGAVGGVAMRHLSDPGVSSVGLIGCGVQGLHQLCYACHTRDIKNIYLYDSMKKDLSVFISDLQAMIAPRTVAVTVLDDTAGLVAASQVVITATQATTPVVPDDPEKLRGKLFIAIGSWKPDMREIPDGIWQVTGEVYTELMFACEESGDLSQPLESGILTPDRVRLMGDYLMEKKAGVHRELGETRFYKSVGMGIFDTIAARQIFLSAKEKGLGQVINW